MTVHFVNEPLGETRLVEILGIVLARARNCDLHDEWTRTVVTGILVFGQNVVVVVCGSSGENGLFVRYLAPCRFVGTMI